MFSDERVFGLRPAWWTTILVLAVASLVLMTVALFSGTLRSFVRVTLVSDRAGLVMEPGAKVKMRGVEVGRVGSVIGGADPVELVLEVFPDMVTAIPSNVGAQIRATTVFGTKYVDLIPPPHPSPAHLTEGAVLRSLNVTSEVNTVFENLSELLKRIDPAKLNSVIGALAEGLRGKGQALGEAITSANDVLLQVNPRMDTLQNDLRSLAGVADVYGAAAQDIVTVLDAVSTTSRTVTAHSSSMDALLLNAIGLSHSGTQLLGASQEPLSRAVDLLEPTTGLLMKYNPEYTCLLLGAKWYLDNGGYADVGGNGRTVVLDSALLLGDDQYRYPDNLPIVAAKGGPGGVPGCGSLPDVTKNYPVRQLVTDTGWGSGLDIRTNPGVGHPFYANYFPVTRAVPEPPSIRGEGPPAPGPAPGPQP